MVNEGVVSRSIGIRRVGLTTEMAWLDANGS